jgi:hypothetical protein
LTYLEKVEAATKKTVVKPSKTTKPKPLPKSVHKPRKPGKLAKPTKPVKFGGKETVAKPAVPSTSFTHLKQALPLLMQMLQVADPFFKPAPGKAGDASWGKFFALAAPEFLTQLLWDLGEIQREEVAAFRRFFKQRVKN